MPYDPPPELAALSPAEVAQALARRQLPPVSEWTPTRSSESHMVIAADGRWFHEGSQIRRPAMIRAFSTLLTRDAAGRHWLVTPFEKQAITVEDAAFIATDLRADPGQITLRLNTDEFVVIGPENPLRATGDAETPALYAAVRHGTEARLNRSTWLQLVEQADETLCIESGGARFSLVPA